VDVRRDGITEGVLVFRRGNQAHAYLNMCPYDGRRMEWMPNQFRIHDGVLTCAVHGDRFRIETGECIGGPSRGRRLYPVPVTVSADGCVVLA
jgi:nitrite reductase/ring-hydroxylating ferredoxin subunit